MKVREESSFHDGVKVIDGKICVSTAFLAEIYGVSKQTIATWGRKGCPRIQVGYWCLSDVIRWKEDNTTTRDTSEENLSLEKQKIYWEKEIRKWRAHTTQLQYQVKKSEYVKTEEVTAQLTSFFAVFKQAVLGIPRKLAILSEKHIGKEEATKLEQEAAEVIDDVLRQWSGGKISGMDTGCTESAETAGENDSQ